MTNPYLHIFESIPLGVVVIDLNGHIQHLNRYAKTILDVDDTDVDNQNIHKLLGPLPIVDLLRNTLNANAAGIKINSNGKVVEIFAAPMIGANEENTKTVITLKDITEVEKLQADEKKNEKNTFLSELSADIAHEIRNPLGSIELLASLFKKEASREKDINRANQIMAAVKTVENAISNLIHRNQKDRLPVANVNIHNLLKEITLFSEKVIDGSGVFLSVSYADVEPVMECNADMMKQVFLYLIINALTGSGRLDIVTHYVEEHRNIEIHFIETSRLDSKNNSIGVFDHPSYTKEDPWGLGMAIIHNIVNMYHGWMRVEYRKSIGTKFVLSFPLVSVVSASSDRTDLSIVPEKDTNEET
jgi:PAS domain S-box-containing protein